MCDVQNQKGRVSSGRDEYTFFADPIVACLEHPAAAGQTYLVSDGEDISTPELIRRIAHALGRSERLLPVPPLYCV